METPALEVVSNRIYITCPTEGASIYYTTNGNPPDPTNSSQLYNDEPLTCSGTTIKAIAVKSGMVNSALFSGSETLTCDPPMITHSNATHFSIAPGYPSPDVTVSLFYSIDGSNPTIPYPGTPVEFSSTIIVKAQAKADGFDDSPVASMLMLPGMGTPDDPYIINDDGSFSDFLSNATNSYYKLTANVNAPSSMSSIQTFSGTLEAAIDPQTKMPYRIKNLSVPIFTTLTGTVKNLVIENVSISQDGKVGSVACTASGSARIYNVGILGGSVKSTSDEVSNSSTGCCGGLVGFLDGEARVVNCYNYADIKGGNRVGGIVGYNNVETKSNNLKTMVFGCMFYGNITGGADKAPIYNGKKISNKDKSNGVTGVSNFNYFRLEAPYVQPTGVTYNCALGAEDRFLQRFEFFRLLLNGYRKLAGWWATGTYSSSEMHKWVMIPDSIGTSHPYPVLKEFGKYPSVVNYDAENAITGKPRNQGGKLGVLTVNIQMGNGAVYNAPTGASIKTNSSSLTLNITDKDTTHFNFNYYKVQLPYYNDVGTKNYTGYRVVTGWKIVKINGSETGTGTYVAGDDVYYDANNNLVTPYNFADRNCTNKDLYSVSGRIFNQGAYWDVPEGVTSITIEPYWAKCAYLADPNADKVYNTGMGTGYDVPNVGGGEQYTDGESYTIAGESQVVYTTRDNAITSSGTGMALFQGVNTTGHTVYDYAVVLVGNYHLYGDPNADNSKPYTLTSVDLDGDNEPDYSYIWRFDNRRGVHPVRVDFINIPGLGMVQKSTGGTGSYNFGILQPKGFFETTNTSLFRVTQLEYDAGRDVTLPIIVQGGVMEQWVGGQGAHKNKITYFHVGGNVWFKEFHRGTHQDQTWQTKHPPVSVTGGDYDEFYLTGLYRGDITNYYDNAECYINGGRFGIVCGAAMEGIGKANGANNTGNITWQIQNADIREFYAGGLNAAEEHTVTGNLSTTITGGYIGVYCGGPKFGDMSSGKTIITNATDCTFGTFFGAGYGGNSYSRYAPANRNNVINLPGPGKVNNVQLDLNSWNDWVAEEYTQNYNDTYRGVSTQFNYQFLPMSNNTENVARLFVEYVKFSLATTHGVTSTLTGCTIIGNFYGGGNLGKVDGQVTSVLESCTAKGNVYGAGQASTLPTVEVDSIGFRVEPLYYTDLGTYRIGVKGQTTIYTWEQGSSISIDTDNHILYTTENLAKTILGSVSQKVTLTIKGNSTVLGSVFGGGDESVVHNNTEVQILENTIVHGNIYGGGNMGEVQGNTRVIVNGDEQQ